MPKVSSLGEWTWSRAIFKNEKTPPCEWYREEEVSNLRRDFASRGQESPSPASKAILHPRSRECRIHSRALAALTRRWFLRDLNPIPRDCWRLRSRVLSARSRRERPAIVPNASSRTYRNPLISWLQVITPNENVELQFQRRSTENIAIIKRSRIIQRGRRSVHCEGQSSGSREGSRKCAFHAPKWLRKMAKRSRDISD